MLQLWRADLQDCPVEALTILRRDTETRTSGNHKMKKVYKVCVSWHIRLKLEQTWFFSLYKTNSSVAPAQKQTAKHFIKSSKCSSCVLQLHVKPFVIIV